MKQTETLAELFGQFRMQPTAIDEYAVVGRQKLIEKMQPWVDAQAPIEFVMLGYPMKSTNARDKVLGTLPDLAEQVSIDNFIRFNNVIKQVYEPGVNITIVSDGLVFNDALGAPDKVVYEYEEVLHDMAQRAPMTFYNLQDFWSRKQGLNAVRGKLMQQFGITEEELQRRILLDADVNFLYRGMMRFMEEELSVKEYDSRNQLHKAAKQLTRVMMMRNEAYSNLVRQEFAQHIRLSMHPSVNSGAKYSFQLIPSPKAWTSPWHCALLVETDGTFATVHKKDALAAGHRIEYLNGRPYNFIQS